MSSPDKAHRLADVGAAAAAFEMARADLHHAVRLALEVGATWSDIGAVLGVSRQAAFQRFGRRRPRPGARDRAEE
jgi:AraC-like DNA-binding protein